MLRSSCLRFCPSVARKAALGGPPAGKLESLLAFQSQKVKRIGRIKVKALKILNLLLNSILCSGGNKGKTRNTEGDGGGGGGGGGGGEEKTVIAQEEGR
uniref:Uncharacterized protein n=1 Tax=Vespula pensylvanica TaxID=30213 RepID=A0A834U8I2_VESPE|nr:hypothetical protein H0235_009442 [Vespula pensylvanica]